MKEPEETTIEQTKETARLGSIASSVDSDAISVVTAKSSRGISAGYNKYIRSKWKQECVPGWRPNWQLSRLHKVLFLMGIPLLGFGVFLWTLRDTGQVYVFDYTDCKSRPSGIESCADLIRKQKISERDCTCNISIRLNHHIHDKVLINYRLKHFHQNLRRYAESCDKSQLVSPFNDDGSPKKPAKVCNKKYSRNKGKTIYPCGQVPNSMFSDIITLSKNGKNLTLLQFPYRLGGFAFRNPRQKPTSRNFTKKFSKPIAWTKEFWELFWKSGGVESSDFQYWMKVSSLSSFKNPYRYFDGSIPSCLPKVKHGLCSGEYVLTIKYNFDVKSIEGRKMIEITSEKPDIVDKRCFLSITCTTVGSFMLLLGFVSLINFIFYKRTKKLKASYSSSNFMITNVSPAEEIKPEVNDAVTNDKKPEVNEAVTNDKKPEVNEAATNDVKPKEWKKAPDKYSAVSVPVATRRPD